MGLTDQMLDIVSKRVAIDLKKNELDNALYDKQWYRESGLPTGFNNGLLNPLRLVELLIRLLNKLNAKEVMMRRRNRKRYSKMKRRSRRKVLRSYGASRGGIRL